MILILGGNSRVACKVLPYIEFPYIFGVIEGHGVVTSNYTADVFVLPKTGFEIANFCTAHGITVILNCTGKSKGGMPEIYASNLNAVKNIFLSIQLLKITWVEIGSFAIYGSSPKSFPRTPLNGCPDSDYGRAKLESLRWFYRVCARDGFKYKSFVYLQVGTFSDDLVKTNWYKLISLLISLGFMASSIKTALPVCDALDVARRVNELASRGSPVKAFLIEPLGVTVRAGDIWPSDRGFLDFGIVRRFFPTIARLVEVGSYYQGWVFESFDLSANR